MKRSFKILFIMLFVSMLFIVGIQNVKAATEHQFSFKAYQCGDLYFDEDAEVYTCSGPENDGVTPEINMATDKVNPGDVIKLGVHYIPSDVNANRGYSLSAFYFYDSSVVSPMYDEDEIIDGKLIVTRGSNSNYGGPFPPSTNSSTTKNTNWGVQYNDISTSSEISSIVKDSKGSAGKVLAAEGDLFYVYFKVDDSASAGQIISFDFDTAAGKTKMANNTAITTTNAGITVDGDVSSNNALGTLSVTNGATTYILDPTFVSNDTTITTYNTVVPNHITSIDINATAYDSTSTISGAGTKNNLKIGDNTFNITVTPQSGVLQTYTVVVRRLNNEARLSSLSLSGINIGTFSDSKTTYTATVPYATSSTSVTADVYGLASGTCTECTATDNAGKATIKSGTGSWTLSNSGETLNTRNVVVQAENCATKYNSVPGNSGACVEKTYTINVTRTAASSVKTLSDLTINGTTVTGFSPTTYRYNYGNVPNSTNLVNLNATVTDSTSTIISTLGNKSLSVGDNTLTVTVQAEDGSTQDYTVLIRRLSNDSSLSGLTVTSDPVGNFTPTFSPGITDYYTYTAPSTVDRVTISATPANSSASVIAGTGEFIIADNPTVNVTVQAEDGSQTIYIVKLVRAKSDNNYLSALSVDGYTMTPTFDRGTPSYTVNVASNVTSVNISATAEDSNATIVSGTGTKALVGGDNNIQITVQAENGTLRYYDINVIKAKKTVAALTDLAVDGVTVPGFTSSTLDYTLTSVPFETQSVVVSATLEDPDSSVSGIGSVNLNTGDNTLYVTVTAEDGVTQTQYSISIERGKDYNKYLSDLTVDGTTISGFLKTKNDYTLTVPNSTTSLNLVATPESSAATVVVSGNSNFVTTAVNQVDITVTAENGDTNLYTIAVTREKSDNNYLSGITLSTGSLNETFVRENPNYTVSVDRSVTTIAVDGVLEDSSATKNVTGPALLEIGQNTFTITVTNEKGVDRTYTVVVTRNKSDNKYLSDLTIDGTTVTGFNKENPSYSVTVLSTTTSVTIVGTPEDTLSSVTGDGIKTINAGDNTFTITVTAEDETTKDYTLVISRSKSTDSTLGSLSVTETTINETFGTTTNYTADVPYGVTSVTISATPNDPNATLTGDGEKNLNTGDNTFNIVVTAEDGTTSTTYTLNVRRAKNNNADLTNLTISAGTLDPSFDTDIPSYNVSVDNSKSQVTIIGYPEDPNATVTISGDTGGGLVNLSTGDNNITVTVTAEDGTTTKNYTIKVNRELSSDATLKELIPSSGTLDPVFAAGTPSYDLSVSNEIETVTFTATPTSDAASVTITGNTNLSVGDNTATITVTAEDGTVNAYTVNITRAQSSNNFLSGLSVKDKSNNEYITSFGRSTLEYNITVENDVDKVDITGTLEDSSSTVTGFGEKELSIGLNSFTITVTSEDNIDKEYVIKINRKSNSNVYLSSLEVVGYSISPSFVKTTTGYTLSVPSNVNTVIVNATAEASTSTVTGTGEVTLVTGTNTLNVDVTAEDGSSSTYIITVTKAASTDSSLSNLSVNPGTLDPGFSSGITTYTVNVDNSTTLLTITATPTDSSSTVTGDGLKSLSVGDNVFDVVVTAEDGSSSTTYTITVNREASSNNYLSDLTIDGTTVTGFNREAPEYEISVDNSVKNITVGATVEDVTATVGNLGNQNLSTGLNTINIPVTAEDGSIRTYVLKVTRAQSSNNNLASLSASEGSLTPTFDPDIISYNITVPYESTSLTLSYTTEDAAATVSVEDNENFIVGNNTVSVVVEAEDGSQKTYTLTVKRQPEATNYLTGITVTDSNNTTYALSPVFNKTTYAYEVELGGSVNQVNVAVTKQESSDTVTGDGTITIASFPQEQTITVTTTDGISREYKLTFVRGLSSNSNLANLTVDKGTLSPVFTKDNTSYTVSLPSGTTSLTVTATPDESTQSISGDGTYTLNDGANTISVTVTAENGSVNTYTIVATVGATDDNKLSSLSVDKGTLSPVFDPDKHIYVVNLDPVDTNITITATGDNNISGTGTKTLAPGANTFNVTTEKDGDIKTYTITVNNGPVASNKLLSLSIDGHTLGETFNKDTNNYTLDLDGTVTDVVVNAIPEGTTSTVTVTGNTGLVEGDNTITITVSEPTLGDNVYTIAVSNINKKITSTIHTVGTVYIPTIHELRNAATIKGEMTNPYAYLHIYNGDTEIADTDQVANGYTIKLIINGREYDSKTLIIKGDVNCNGEVEVADSLLTERYILRNITLTAIQLEAGDVNEDGGNDVADLILIERHILKNYDLFTKEER